MKDHNFKITVMLMLASICTLSLFSCKREPPTVPAEPTTDAQTTVAVTEKETYPQTLPLCASGHSFSDGVCSVCKTNACEFEFMLSDSGDSYTLTALKYTLTTEITVPSSYNGKPVKAIGKAAFKNMQITAAVLPEGITSVGDEAFHSCYLLESIVLPTTLEGIGKNAFEHCDTLKELTIPKSLKSIGADAFASCKLELIEVKSFAAWCAIDFEDLDANPMHKGALFTMDGEPISKIVFDENETKIKKYTFAGCKNLVSIVLPKKLDTICEGAFYGCTALEQIEMFKGIKSIKDGALEECSALSVISFDGTCSEWNSIKKADNWDTNTVKFNIICSDDTITVKHSSEGLKYFLSPEGFADVVNLYKCTDTEVTVPAKYKGLTVKGILQSSFANAKSVTAITLPQSVSRIHNGAFSGCTSLVSINIPKAVTSIPSGMLAGCTALADIYYGGTKEEFIKLKKDSLWDHGTPDYTVHCSDGDLGKKEVNNIEGLIFTLNSNKASYSLSSIGSFTGSVLEIPAEYKGLPVTSIKKGAFDRVYGIRSVILPEGILTIADGSFTNSGIQEISIPSTLKTVYNSAFSGTAIQRINIASIESWCNISFSVTEGNPAHNGADLFLNGELVTEITIPYLAKGVGQYQFYGCRSIEKVTLDKAITKIGTNAFAECHRLKEILLPDTLTTLHDDAFKNCFSLSSFTVPSSLTQLNRSFGGCFSLKSITIPNTLKSVTASVFTSCPLLEEINYGGTVAEWKSISIIVTLDPLSYVKIKCKDGMLEHFPSDKVSILLSIEPIPEKEAYAVAGIGGCSDTSLIIGSKYGEQKIMSIGKGAFYEKQLSSVNILDGITSIGEEAFFHTNVTKYIRIPKSITEIGMYALYSSIDNPYVTLYDGTIAEWNRIIGADNSGARLVICTDGVIS